MRYTDDDLRRDLEAAIEAAGGVRRYAEKVGLSAAFISLVRWGRSAPGAKLAKALGYTEDDKRWIKRAGGKPRPSQRACGARV